VHKWRTNDLEDTVDFLYKEDTSVLLYPSRIYPISKESRIVLVALVWSSTFLFRQKSQSPICKQNAMWIKL